MFGPAMFGPALITPHRRRARIGVLVAALVGGLLVSGVVPGTTPSAHAAVCGPGVTTFVWDGAANDTAGQVGDGKDWGDRFNWNVDCVPGDRMEPVYDDDVTIPAGANVTLGQDESAQIVALHNNGSLTITPTAALVTSGPSTSKTITVQGTLAGTSTFTVTTTMKWVATAQGSSTMETRWCGKADTCTTTASSVGTTVINAGATLAISGRGVILGDQRIIENHGTTKLSGMGYIAANYGTEFRNLRTTGGPVPKFVIANSTGGYLQGFSSMVLPISVFTNGGLLTKTVGPGTSVIDANYTQTTAGSTQVHAGTLSIFTPGGSTTRTATVQQGAQFSDGGCTPGATPASCQVQPTGTNEQVSSVQLTKTGSTSASVSIQELTTNAGAPAGRGFPVAIETGAAQADPTHPLRFRLYLDSQLLTVAERGNPTGVANTAPVWRQATMTDPYLALPNCNPTTQNPTTAVPVCVARGLSVSETSQLAGSDVVIVISSLQNSRYRVS